MFVSARQGTPAERLDAWRQYISETFVPVRVHADDPGMFRHGSIQGSGIGSLSVYQVTADPTVLLHTPAAPGGVDSEADLYKVKLQIHGSCVVAQEGKEAALKPGDFTLFDARRSYRFDYKDHYRAVFVLLPPKLLPFSQKRLAQLEMAPIPGQQGIGALVSTFLTGLAKQADSLDGHDAARLSDNVLDLLAMAFAQRLDCASDIPSATRGKALCTQVKYYIEQHLDDPRLSPAAIAAAHYISTRYLHKVFERDDITVTGLIRTRRLAKIRKDLANPLLDDRPVADVGARWGLVNASQVSRLFRDAYGVSPREYRALAATGRAAEAA